MGICDTGLRQGQPRSEVVTSGGFNENNGDPIQGGLSPDEEGGDPDAKQSPTYSRKIVLDVIATLEAQKVEAIKKLPRWYKMLEQIDRNSEMERANKLDELHASYVDGTLTQEELARLVQEGLFGPEIVEAIDSLPMDSRVTHVLASRLPELQPGSISMLGLGLIKRDVDGETRVDLAVSVTFKEADTSDEYTFQLVKEKTRYDAFDFGSIITDEEAAADFLEKQKPDLSKGVAYWLQYYKALKVIISDYESLGSQYDDVRASCIEELKTSLLLGQEGRQIPHIDLRKRRDLETLDMLRTDYPNIFEELNEAAALFTVKSGFDHKDVANWLKARAIIEAPEGEKLTNEELNQRAVKLLPELMDLGVQLLYQNRESQNA